jgi:NAD(P)-dependent dehydrogenase (short-subunit alcohol dehydrogenase family)
MNRFSLEGRVAIVTGSGQGIGEAIALTFAEAGAQLVIVDINIATAEATADDVRALGKQALVIPADVRDRGQVDNMIIKTLEKFEHIDIMVNNAGFGYMTVPLVEMVEEDWDKGIILNLKSIFVCCKAVGRVMIRQKKGNIINMSSMAGLVPYPMAINYSAAKAGVINLTQTLAVELAPHNIRVNALAPGVIETPLTAELYKKRPDLKEQRLEHIPLGRLGKPQDIANAALFLASEASSYISGQTILVNGAMTTFVTPKIITELSKCN